MSKWKSTREKKAKQERNEELWLEFKKWWEPYTHDPKTGAEVGGHPHARRTWANTKGKRVVYGVPVEEAFNCQCYIDEYRQWLKDGQSVREPEMTGNCATKQRVAEVMNAVSSIMGGDPF